MSKRRFICLIFVVMFGLCAIKWNAQGDVAIPQDYHNIRGASFDLTVSDTGSALELTIKPATSGDYSYSFSLVSGDTELTVASKDSYFYYKAGKLIKASFDCALPEPDKILRYSVKASFTPNDTPPADDKDKIISGDIVSKDKPSPNNGGSCGLYVMPAAADLADPYNYRHDVVERMVPREFSAKAEVRNVKGTAYVEITETYEPPFEEYSYY